MATSYSFIKAKADFITASADNAYGRLFSDCATVKVQAWLNDDYPVTNVQLNPVSVYYRFHQFSPPFRHSADVISAINASKDIATESTFGSILCEVNELLRESDWALKYARLKSGIREMSFWTTTASIWSLYS